MHSGINIDYTITADYSSNYLPSYIPILDIYNTVLIPIEFLENLEINIGDTIGIVNSTTNQKYTQTIVIEYSKIILNYQEYYYFYIGNGLFIDDHNQNFILQLNDHTFPLSLKLANPHICKLIKGLLVLPDNYSHTIYKQTNHLMNIDNNEYKVYVIDLINKFNYFLANKSTTLIKILHETNYEVLQNINTSNQYVTSYIRPLCNPNFPLGSLSIQISNNNGVFYPIEYELCVNNNKYLVNDYNIKLQNLQAGQYSIKIIDKSGLLNINRLNNQDWNTDSFNILIPSVNNNNNEYRTMSLPSLYKKTKPQPGLCNIMINLMYSEPVEIFGPNNFYYKSEIGYFGINNINSGYYTIQQKDQSKQYLIFANDTTYINELSS